MKQILACLSSAMLLIGFLTLESKAQTFTNSQSTLGSGFNSGGCVGVVDMDGDGLDDVMILDQSRTLYIAYQESDGSFSNFSYGMVSSNQQWGSCVADIDGDGHKDVFSGGAYDGVHVEYISSRGQSTSDDLNNGSMFMQACNIVDIDNDGHLDVFACHDDALSRTWKNDGNGALSFDGNLMDLLSYDFSSFPNTDHSGNYGTVWSDFDDDGDVDLYIAKCRQGVSNSQDPRRVNQLWVNDGNGNYTEQAAARGLQLFEQSWTADFADINNDGDLDCLVTNHTGTLMLLENDGTGNFTDISSSAGVALGGFFLQAKMEDMDNDGFVDIIYSGGLDGYLRNNGDNTFSSSNVFPYSDVMHSFSLGDLNDDGFIDLYASYGSIYVGADLGNDDILWLNDGNSNNWVSFDLEGIFSNQDAVGAKVKLYGPWGIQVREVRAGESYGITNSSKCHFGIGSETAITSAEVIWPSGTITTIDNPEINTVHQVLEAPCLLSEVTLSPSGDQGLCPGTTIELDAPSGFDSYLWSNGETSSSIIVSEEGNYSLVVTDNEGCVGQSANVEITLVEPEVAEVIVEGDTEFCQGFSVTLSANEGASYLWSNGATEQTIEVGEDGSYDVQVTDICGNINSSETVPVNVFETFLPEVEDEVIIGQGIATFTGIDTDLQWYANEGDLDPIATGESFTTPELTETTSYWVENPISYPGENASGGRTSQGVGQHHTNSNNYLLFDAFENFTLESVKVWANGGGNRTIEMIDNNGNTVHTATFNIPDGEQVVELNWEVEAGSGYGLRTLDGNPQLWRDAPPTNLNYPYALGDLGAITSSSITGTNQFNYYYFFYDWQVSVEGVDCVSERVEVTALVGDAGCTDPNACNFNSNSVADDGSCLYDCGGCPGDINGNGAIGTDDLVAFLGVLGCQSDCSFGDFNSDDAVNSADLTFLLGVFGTFCSE